MDYRQVADQVAEDIARGVLRAGEQLPTQRQFARRRGIAVSTASRVYAELARRGLVVGEVGRGTFVRAGMAAGEVVLGEPAAAAVDLELNFPVLPEHAAILAEGLRATLRPDAMADAIRATGPAGTLEARRAAAGLLARGGWRPDADDVLFAGNGRQAIAGVLAALVPPGERLGVEEMTYAVVKGIAARLAINLVPLAMDDEGVTPAALRAAGPVKAVYLQPALQNPLGVSMSARRRQEVSEVLRSREIPLVEDTIYGFLHDDPPLSALLPDNSVLVDSLSKRLAPGLSLGFAVTRSRDRVISAIRSGGWGPQRFALAAATGWITGGVADRLRADKRADALRRQEIVADKLAGFDVRADPRAYHCWWVLPAQWRAETFVAAAARSGIAVTPAAAFAIGTARAPHAVRLALASPPLPVLAAALERLAGIARADDPGPD
ncbi:PLP-dependent aminotransferase family protein [Actinokineospora sp. NBRC 105648]|uniref:aminotransferase-like domain-containing protein n=1 Tax=Actinokineospora sp. NBRC 105648 TaxID=3032206 RepID=UPI0024A4084E|nr:PLP-dependent aminotransferase family protein [Actinokineospora sp. NBRC 105648]GLZ43291.1 GntR family transcriptional regulator [Actinokineospora sp. NBRC 105648]